MSPSSSAEVHVHIPAIMGVGATVVMSEALVDNLDDVRGVGGSPGPFLTTVCRVHTSSVLSQQSC